MPAVKGLVDVSMGKCLWHNHEDLNLGPQKLHVKLGAMFCTCNDSTRWVGEEEPETGRSLTLIGQPA